MKEEVQIKYTCDHCGYINLVKEVMEKHEEDCSLNPKNRVCKFCERKFKNKYNKDQHEKWCEKNPDRLTGIPILKWGSSETLEIRFSVKDGIEYCSPECFYYSNYNSYCGNAEGGRGIRTCKLPNEEYDDD